MRHQLPVYSPLTLAALANGANAMLWGGRAEDAAVAAIRTRWGGDVLPTASGTAALTLALHAGLRRRAAPVALPAFCCFDVATAADGAGGDVMLYDLDPSTLGPDLASLERVLAAGAGTIVVAHLYGVPVDLPAVERLAAAHDALVIEDAAQGAGIEFGRAPAGTFSPLGVLSFGRGKGITGGGGGALLANDGDGRELLAAIRGQVPPGRNAAKEPVAAAAQWLLGRPSLYWLPASLPFLGLGETVYRKPEPVRGPSRFSAGVLERTCDLADAETAVRRTNAEAVLRILPRGLEPVRGFEGARPGWLRLPVLAQPNHAAALRSMSARRLGIMPAYPQALADLPGFGMRVRNAAAPFPGARVLAERLFTLPTHSRVEALDLANLARLFAKLSKAL